MQITVGCFQAFQVSISYENLPATFQNAVDITRSLNSQYLWIDALCILQVSKEDWAHESSKMSQIYTNARLNIAATASSNSHGGLRRHASSRAPTSCLVTLSWTGLDLERKQYTCTDRTFWERNINFAPLLDRGWVLQERILAPRILHFAEEQLFWERRTTSAYESMPLGLPRYLHLDHRFKQQPTRTATLMPLCHID
jgi:hypothetical protein